MKVAVIRHVRFLIVNLEFAVDIRPLVEREITIFPIFKMGKKK